MADALEVTPTIDTIVSIDVVEIHMEPVVNGSTPQFRYSLLVTWSSGRTETRSKLVKPSRLRRVRRFIRAGDAETKASHVARVRRIRDKPHHPIRRDR
jgi:hypothetical protein